MAATYVLGTLRHWEFRLELPPGWLPALLFLALVFVRTVPFLGAARSLDPQATWREGVKLLTVAAFFLVCYNTYRTATQARRALWTMVVMGTLISIFGIVQRLTWNRRLNCIGRPGPRRRVTRRPAGARRRSPPDEWRAVGPGTTGPLAREARRARGRPDLPRRRLDQQRHSLRYDRAARRGGRAAGRERAPADLEGRAHAVAGGARARDRSRDLRRGVPARAHLPGPRILHP